MIIAIAALSSACSQPEPESFSVCFYNAYLLFDSADDGWEYEGFRKSDGYTEEAYEERIRSLAVFLAKHADADAIILAEVESEEVLADLIESGLDTRGYRYYGIARGDEPLSVAFVSRRMPDDVNVHSADGARPFLELRFGDVTVFGIHARSRLESGSPSVRFREFAHLSLLLQQTDGAVAAVGDFNADPRYPEEGMALYPSASWRDIPLNVTADPGQASGNIFYAPLLDEIEEEGTYWYEGSWYFYDNILLSGSILSSDWQYAGARIVRAFEAEDILGRPDAYDASTGRGYSDHFPVEVRLRSF